MGIFMGLDLFFNSLHAGSSGDSEVTWNNKIEHVEFTSKYFEDIKSYFEE
jgi:hypothetical protein